MLAEERRARIASYVNDRGSASLAELAQMLDASESTVRRDVDALSRMGRVNRVHGGATRTSGGLVLVDQAYEERKVINAAQKDAIGAYAATLVGPDDFVFVDAGTTTLALVSHLTETHATYMTNSLPIAQHLLARGCRTLVTAGEVKPATEAIVGEAAVESLRPYHFTIGFFGTNGFDPATGFTTPELSEACVKRVAMEHTLRPYVVCDSSKFSKVSLVTFAESGSASIICDQATPDIRQAMRATKMEMPTVDLVEVA